LLLDRQAPAVKTRSPWGWPARPGRRPHPAPRERARRTAQEHCRPPSGGSASPEAPGARGAGGRL